MTHWNVSFSSASNDSNVWHARCQVKIVVFRQAFIPLVADRAPAKRSRLKKTKAAEREYSRPAELSRIVGQKILTALSKVFQTPQASGIPTNSQNKAAGRSSP